MIIEDLIMLGKKVIKDNILKSKKVTLSQRFKSLSQASTESTYFFPIACSEQATPDEIAMSMKLFERNYAIFTRTAFSLIPYVEMSSSEYGIKEHLSKVHQNIGVMPNMGSYKYSLEASTENINYGVLNENNASNAFVNHVKAKVSNDNTSIVGNSRGQNGQAAPITVDYEWKKANEVLPTTVNIPLRVNGDNMDLPVHIKANVHKVPTSVLVQDIVKSMNQSKGFLNFVQYVSGEQKSLVDFLFGVSNMKEDILKTNSSPWLDAFKRRKRLANLAWGTVADNYKPIGTIVLTMNEVNILKNQYEIDVFVEAKKIMTQYFLLGFMILDQTNETAHILFDSFPGFQEYPYKTLEREASNQDKTLRDMIRAMGRI
jgi:hypothetical protein